MSGLIGGLEALLKAADDSPVEKPDETAAMRAAMDEAIQKRAANPERDDAAAGPEAKVVRSGRSAVFGRRGA